MKKKYDPVDATVRIASIRANQQIRLARLRYGTLVVITAGLLALAAWSDTPFRLRALFFEFQSGHDFRDGTTDAMHSSRMINLMTDD